MDPDRQDNPKALRARRKAEQVALYTNKPEASESGQQAYQPYVDIYSGNPEQPKSKPYGDSMGRADGNAPKSEILEYLEAIKSRKLLILFTAFAGAVYGIFSLIPEPPIYEASTTLEIQGLNEAFMGMNQVDPQAGTGNYSPNQMNLTTQLRIIESATLRSTVYDMLQREITPVAKPQIGFMAKLRGRYGSAATQDPLEYTKDALGMAIGSIHAGSLTGTRIIFISTESTSPEVAALVVNAMADEYISQYSQQRSGSSQKAITVLDSVVEETKVKLAQAENKLRDFMRSSGTVFAPGQDTLASSQLKQLQGSLAAIQTDRIAKESRYRAVTASSPETLPEIAGDGGIREIQSKLTELKRQRAVFLTTLTPTNPKVAKLDDQITFLEEQYAKERDNVIGRIKNEYETARRQEQLLQKEYSSKTGTVLSQSDKTVEYNLLDREAQNLRMQLTTFLQQANQANSTSALPTNNVRVIDRAKAPSLPSRPNSFQRVSSNLMVGGILGCLIALGRAKYLKNRSSRKFAEPGHASALLQVPELGVIPSARSQMSRKNRWAAAMPWKRGDVRLLQDGTQTLVGDGGVDLMALLGTPSLLADSFRLMVVSITLLNKDANANSFVVTSPGPAEGKTTLISNLAAVMAETGRRVLLIDMDLRKPRLHHIFGVDSAQGFTDLITGDAPMDAATVAEFIQQTKIPGVSIIPCGRMLDLKSINQLFYSPRTAAFMKIVRKMVDIVLIDAPPMMQFSEARLMASMADRVILVLRSGSTDRETALACQRRLAEDGANLLGTILNDWDPSASNVDYNGYYSYYHHQVEEK